MTAQNTAEFEKKALDEFHRIKNGCESTCRLAKLIVGRAFLDDGILYDEYNGNRRLEMLVATAVKEGVLRDGCNQFDCTPNDVDMTEVVFNLGFTTTQHCGPARAPVIPEPK